MGPHRPPDRRRTLRAKNDQSDALARLDRGEADVLVAAKIDRVSRSTTDFAKLLDHAEKKGWKLVVLDADVDTTQPWATTGGCGQRSSLI